MADGPRPLFEGVDLALEPGVRACLVGRNGAGKSTRCCGCSSARPSRTAASGRLTPGHADQPRGPGTQHRRRQPAGLRQRRRRAAARGRVRAASVRARSPPRDPGSLWRGGHVGRRWPGLLPRSPTCCCSTSRPTTSTSLRSRRWRRCWPPSRAAAPWWSATTARSWSASPSGASGWRTDGSWRLDKGFAAFDAWSARIAADQAESLRRLSKAIERETYTFPTTVRSPPSAPATRAGRGSWRRCGPTRRS